jgi:spore coat polysaccharide biosynthesis protein SpsF (cytidylyltransferase family)
MIEVSCSDIDFYERKIARLEEDNVMLHEELANVRSRLRTAQDYEIRYELLMQSSNDEIQRLRSGQAKAEEARREEYVAIKLRENNEKWRVEMLQLEENTKKAAQEELKAVQISLNEANERLADLKKKGE